MMKISAYFGILFVAFAMLILIGTFAKGPNLRRPRGEGYVPMTLKDPN